MSKLTAEPVACACRCEFFLEESVESTSQSLRNHGYRRVLRRDLAACETGWLSKSNLVSYFSYSEYNNVSPM